MMNNLANRFSNEQKPLQTDDLTSLTSSTSRRRLVRKTDDSILRRSSSKRSLQKAEASIDLSKFYKGKGNVNLLTNECSTNRQIIINRNPSPRAQKKRPPTPAPRQKKEYSPSPDKRKKSNNIENDLLITELEAKLEEEKFKTISFEKRFLAFEKELKKKTQKVNEFQQKFEIVQKEMLQYRNREQQYKLTIKQYQQVISKNTNNLLQLSDTKSKLQKLKKSIKQSRFSQQQIQLNKTKLEIYSLRESVERLKNQNQKLSASVHILQVQNSVLSSKVKPSKQRVSPLQDENGLVELLSQKMVENSLLSNQLNKVEMKLNYQNRLKYQDMEKLRNKKNEQISLLRKKIAGLYLELKQSKKQVENNSLSKSSKTTITSRTSRIDRCSTEQLISFSLSPQR